MWSCVVVAIGKSLGVELLGDTQVPLSFIKKAQSRFVDWLYRFPPRQQSGGFCRASEMGSDRRIRRRGEVLVKLWGSVTLVVSGYS